MEQLLLVYDDISASVDSGSIVDLVLFYYSKAFNVVFHKVLLTKLHSIGVDGQILSWISSFLTDKKMQVTVKSSFSSSRVMHSRVPQGLVIGPLSFLVHINHICFKLTSKHKTFADDIKIYSCVSGNPLGQCLVADNSSLQNDIDLLNCTSKLWGLKINREKCAVLHFSRKFKAGVWSRGGAVPTPTPGS